MKKEIIIAWLSLLCIMSLTGCIRAEESQTYDQKEMEKTAEYIVSSFSQMEEEDVSSLENTPEFELNLLLAEEGIPIDAEDFLSMANAWSAGQDECGEFLSFGDYTLEEGSDGASLILPVEGTSRSGEITFEFNSQMGLESLTVSGDYTMSEILEKAGMNTILGMGTVFVVLIFISFIIYLLKFIPVLLEKQQRRKSAEIWKEEKAGPEEEKIQEDKEQKTEKYFAEQTAVMRKEAEPVSDPQLVAVIAAAVAAFAEQDISGKSGGFVVRSIRRRKQENRRE